MSKKSCMSNLDHDVEIIKVTPTAAKGYIDGTFDRNRPIVKDAVTHYRKQMEKGAFLNATPIILALIETTNKLVLVDGQHRLSAVVQWKKPMKFTLMTYYLENEEQLAELYATIDVGRSRNLSDNVRAQGFQQESGLNQIESTRFVSSIHWAETKKPAFQAKTSAAGSYADQISKGREWLHIGQEYFRITRAAKGTMKVISRRKTLVACGLITIKAQPNKAAEFWHGVFTLDNIPADDPRNKLHHKLMEIGAQGHQSRGVSKHQVMTSVGLAKIVCTCWNAFISNRKLHVVKPIKTIVFNRCKWREEK